MRFSILTFAIPLLAACSEYDLAGGDDPTSPKTDTASESQGQGDSGEDGPPPNLLEGDCPPGSVAVFDQSEIYVTSWDNPTASGVLITDHSGWYHVYDYSVAESGAEQTNESAWFNIQNAASTYGKPYWSNCDDEWVVQDSDNNGFPSDTRIYVGTFWLEPGENQLTLNHYCPLYRAGSCPEFHIDSDASSTCDSNGANSAHFNGEGICLVTADPA